MTRQAQTLVALLRQASAQHADRVLYRFLADGERETECWTYGDLDLAARRIARELQSRGLAGERVVIAGPSCGDYVAAFFGCLYAGAIAVPARHGVSRRDVDAFAAIVSDSTAAAVLTCGPIAGKLAQHGSAVAQPRHWLEVAACRTSGEADWIEPSLSGESIAYLQYTSGSTTAPKGVVIRHANVLANEHAIAGAFALDEHSIVVGWLPLHHDMGLAGIVLQPLYVGATAILFPPAAFLQRPARWLRVISDYRATTSGGPDFAYDLCARRLSAEDMADLNLASWTVAFNGSEPVRADTLDRFAEAFAPVGFRREAFLPCYGLAEATLIVTGERDHLGVVPASRADGETGIHVVSSGASAPGQTVMILDPETGAELPDGRVGEICVSGASIAREYWNRPDATAETFRSGAHGVPVLHTGDLGFRRDGRLFVNGRLKDLIIIRGANYYPEDLELSAGGSHASAVRGATAAFAVASDSRERLVIVQEIARHGVASDALCAAIRDAVWRNHDVAADTVVIVPHGSIPRTSSGKIRRGACRAAYDSGELSILLSDSLPVSVSTGEEVEPIAWHAVDQASDEARPALVRQFVAQVLAGGLGLSVRDLPDDRRLSELGLDSMKALELAAAFADETGIPLVAADCLGDATVETLAVVLLAGRTSANANAQPIATPDSEHGTVVTSALSIGQQALWYVERLAEGAGLFNIAAAASIEGQLEPEFLRSSFQILVDRHPALRTAINVQDGRPVGTVHARRDVDFACHDITGTTADQETALLHRHARASFDLGVDPLMRVRLFGRGPTRSTLLVVVHHQVADFWSLAILLDELGQLLGGADRLPSAPRRDWRDLARHEAAWLANASGRGAIERALAALMPCPPALDLPFDRPRPPVQTYAGASRPFHIPAEVIDALTRVTRLHGTTLHTALLAAYETFVHRLTGRTDFLIGTPSAGRTAREWHAVIGYFVTPLVLKASLHGHPTYVDVMRGVRDTMLAALSRQRLPFPILAERLGIERDQSRPPVFQTMFALQTPPPRAIDGLAAFAAGVAGARLELGGLVWESKSLEPGTSEFDLSVICCQTTDGLRGRFQYNTDLFDATTIDRLADRFTHLVATFARDPRHTVSLPLLTPAERDELLREATIDPVVPFDPVHRAFEHIAAAMPQARALIDEDRILSFETVNRRANALARQLVARGHRIGSASIAAMCLDRCAELPIAMLAALKAGVAYLPLDPSLSVERLTQTMTDAGVSTLITTRRLASRLEGCHASPLLVDEVFSNDAGDDGGDESRNQEPVGNVDARVAPDDVAYLLYTSGSTGVPKGVLVTHQNLATFFTAMDERVGCGPSDVMLATTGVTFDISVLELIWTLTRGCAVVITSPPGAAHTHAPARPSKPLDYSLFYFAQDMPGVGGCERYRLLLEGARFADAQGFAAVWTPERHFDAFGGLYPNPSITSAALAMITERVGLRAGSVVLPLHNPIRVAEDWALVDNLSNGRVAIAFASGWHADDFALAPQNYQRRKEVMQAGIETVRRLWRGERLVVPGGSGDAAIRITPRPVQPELPIWITAAGSEETFQLAGRLGANLLTHLLGQTVDELARAVGVYRRARAEHGFDPDSGIVTLMVHTFIGRTHEEARQMTREPMKRYLRGAFGLVAKLVRQLDAAFDPASMNERDREALLDHAFERYFDGDSLMGSAESCRVVADRLADAGVNDVACLIDFGIDDDVVLSNLPRLADLRTPAAMSGPRIGFGFAEQAARYRPTLMQCTPSLLGLLLTDSGARAALSSLNTLLVGGEAMPPGLAATAATATNARILNMYGPTETTVWSMTHEVDGRADTVPIGTAIRGTQVYVLDAALQLVGRGGIGELYIGGVGVARGYHRRPSLTASRFVANPLGATPGDRLYRTGDLVKRRSEDGAIEWLGRTDLQVKIRGHRIELGEIEAALLAAAPDIREAAVVATPGPAGPELIGYVTPASDTLDVDALRDEVRRQLPAYMVPRAVIALSEFPRTSNGKLDRRALAARPRDDRPSLQKGAAARSALEAQILAIWSTALGRTDVGVHDNFFDAGGHSLLMARVHGQLQTMLGREWPLARMLEHPTVAAIARYLEGGAESTVLQAAEQHGQTRRSALLKRRAVAASLRA